MLGFGLAYSNKRDINLEFLERMMASIKKMAPLLISLILSVKSLLKSKRALYLTLIKVLAILIIFYRSIYENNSNYFLLLVAIYFYFVRAKVDTIILFNHLSILILYNILLKKLRNITF